MLGQIARNLSIVMAESCRQGETYPLPTLETLLADSRFDPLRRFIADGPVPPADLQQAIDDLLANLDRPAAWPDQDPSGRGASLLYFLVSLAPWRE